MRTPDAGHRAPSGGSRWVTGIAWLVIGLAWGCTSSRPATRGVGTPRVEEGLASWYGEPFDGRATSSGEIFDMEKLTAAHRTLAFGTRLLVTNTLNSRAVEVLVNDRGPFVAGRILDLSWGAAKALDMMTAGVVPVRAEVVAPGDGMPAATCWEVQVGAFRLETNAARARGQLEERGHATRLAPAGGGLTRVRVADLTSRQAALVAAAALSDLFPGAAVVPCAAP